ncbi:ovostatin-like [Lissotriton helveticus]
MWGLLLSCALLVIHGTAADMQYLVYTAPVHKSNQTGKVCLEAVGVSEPTPMKVVLQIPTSPITNVSFFDQTLPAGEFRQCKDMPIPSVAFPTLASLIVISGNQSTQRNVVVNGVKPFCVGQMEKQIYKPGETMRCRVTCLNGNLRPEPQTVTTFQVLDPSGNIVKQETNVEMQDTFAMLSFTISSEPSTGFYQMRATFPSETVTMSAEVKRYALPTFEVNFKTPSSVSSIDLAMEVGVSGSYTYGESLGANVELSVCRKPNQFGPAGTCNLNPNGICRLYSGSLKPDGSFTVKVDLQLFQLNQRGLQDNLIIEATITEKGTGVQVFKSANVWVSRQMPNPYFNYQVTDTCYRQGINTTGSLILRDGNNKGISDQSIALYIAFDNVANCVSDKNGNCNFSFDTSKYMGGKLVLEARYDQNQQCFESSPSWTGQPNNYPQLTLQRCYSPSGSFLKIKPVEGELRCGQSVTIKAECILNRTSLLSKSSTVTATYKVMSKAEFKRTGEGKITLDRGGKGSFSFKVLVNADLAPTATIMASILLGSGEVVGHHITVQVQKCFDNKVNVTFYPEKVRPGSNVSITVEAAPGSICAFSAKDASVNILDPNSGLSWSSMVYNQIPYIFSSGSFIDGFSLVPNQFVPCADMPDIVLAGVNYQATPDVNNAVDWQQEVLNSAGLIAICGHCMPKPNVCPKPDNCPTTPSPPTFPVPFLSTVARGSNVLLANDGAFAGRVVESVRTSFPEMWMYEIVKIGSAGRADLSRKVPDTITNWVCDVPCNSYTRGFGALDEPKGLTVFQDFFVDYNMGPTLVRGEVCFLKVTAFNYQKQCAFVELTLAPSADYNAQLISVDNACICQNGRTTATYAFSANKLRSIDISVTAETKPNSTCSGAASGIQYKDTVIRPLFVFAEGLAREETQGALLCSKDGPVSQSINVNPHPQMVNDSARIIVSCVGDPIGLSAQYLNDLVQMPTGCAEQTLSMLLANLLVREYMNVTGKLDQAFKEKSDYNIANGAGNMVKFHSSLGCLTTWQNSFSRNFWTQTSCSLWLTCLGLVTLNKAKEYTFVEPGSLNQLYNWIISQQDPLSGAFLTDGNSYNKILESNATISAFVIISIFEYSADSSSVVNRVLDYLGAQVESMAKPLEMVMTCYAFILANKTEPASRLLEKLKAFENTGEEGLFLQDPNDQTSGSTLFFPWNCNSVTNLQTAYYALCLIRSGADSAKLLPIMRFLGKQMNSHGGFCSSQDTAPALQAVIALVPRIYTKGGANTVTIQSGGRSISTFTVNPSNNMVLQQTDVLPLPGSYKIDVSGNGCVYCQTTVKYNVKPENMKQTFSVDVQISPATCENGDAKKIDINITMSYTGKNNASNMVLVDVQLLSGFQPMESNLTALVNQGQINQYDLTTVGHVTMYINRVPKDAISVAFTIIETTPVQNRKKATVYVGDYYQRDEIGYAQYAHPCSTSSSEA